MKTCIAHEETLVPDLALPIQFQQIWHEPSEVAPERALAVGVLWQAVNDLRTYRSARWGKRQRLYMDAYRWVMSNDRAWPYSFVNICEAVGLSPQFLRAELLNRHKSAPEPQGPQGHGQCARVHTLPVAVKQAS